MGPLKGGFVTRIINPNFDLTSPPPVMESRRWLDGMDFAPDRPLINLSQAAPVEPPPKSLRAALAEAALNDPGAHLYGPVLGLPELRAEVASQWSQAYGGAISPGNVAITSGCNQAFCAAVSTLARAGDAVLIPAPWYFNHKMWLDMMGIKARVLPLNADMHPDVVAAKALIDDKTRAIVLVTPNNPVGVEYPGELLAQFYDLAKAKGITLIVDETYRDFDSRSGAPHSLFDKNDWDSTLIHLYSFSKAYRLTGHRVGAMIAAPARLAAAEKFLDTMTICPNQLGQRGALFGLLNLSDWLAGQRSEILARRAAITSAIAGLTGWTLLGVGAYFTYVAHPFDLGSTEVAKKLLRDQSVLMLPGTMFAPTLEQGGDGAPERQLRIAYANVDRREIAALFDRLHAFST